MTALLHGDLGGEEPGRQPQTLPLVLSDVPILQFAVGGDVPSLSASLSPALVSHRQPFLHHPSCRAEDLADAAASLVGAIATGKQLPGACSANQHIEEDQGVNFALRGPQDTQFRPLTALSQERKVTVDRDINSASLLFPLL